MHSIPLSSKSVDVVRIFKSVVARFSSEWLRGLELLSLFIVSDMYSLLASTDRFSLAQLSGRKWLVA